MTKNKILAVGDLHCNFHQLNSLIAEQQPDIVLQCGDFGWWPHWHGKPWKKDTPAFDQYSLLPGSTKVHWCDGNHENHDDIYERLVHNPDGPYEFAGPNVFYQPRGSVLQLPDGRNVVFFGGAESIDKHMRVEGATWWRGELPNSRDYAALEGNLERLGITSIDIMVTHTAPQSFLELLGFTNGARVLDPTTKFLEHILEKYTPAQWYFGHFHMSEVGHTKGCAWTALGTAGSEDRDWYAEVGVGQCR